MRPSFWNPSEPAQDGVASHQGRTGITLNQRAAVDWLRAAQFTAAFLASLVSLCALRWTAPQAASKVCATVAKVIRLYLVTAIG